MTQIKNNFIAKSFDNFLNEEEVNIYLQYCSITNKWANIPNSFWDKRVINFNIIKTENLILRKIILKTINNIQQKMIEEYNLTEVPYPDTLDIVRWFPGMEQTPHCDDMSDSDSKQQFKHRYFGCIIYLNDDYGGGYTYYPEHNFSIKPKSGKLAIHLGDCNHRHGVTKILNKTRYTIASFWGFNKNKTINLS